MAPVFLCIRDGIDKEETMKSYQDLARMVLEFGEFRHDRTGVGTYAFFSPGELRYAFSDGFPIITTKRLAWRFIVAELLWFLRGETNVRSLQRQGVDIWDEWANQEGDLGPVYGKQWRSWERHDGTTIDQIAQVIEALKTNPQSRRHIVSAWNVAQVPEMALPPCHLLFQFYASNAGTLHVKVTQRSADIFLGLPYNISSYATLLAIIARLVNLEPGSVIMSLGDAHVYQNHIFQMREQLSRIPRKRPVLVLPDFDSLDEVLAIDPKEFVLKDYDAWPSLKAKIAV